MVLQIWNTGPNSHIWRQGICQQTFGRNDGANELFTHQNLAGAPSVQLTSGSVQQNSKKYLASFVDDTALNWETFLTALVFSYNSSYHSTIATMPFKLLFGEKARLPSFPNEDIQKVHYGETSAAERFNLLQKLRKLAH